MIRRTGFTVIIPTLQRSDLLEDLLRRCDAHPLVDEILVINNAVQPLETRLAKVRVMHQGRNIYVNPAWNLGAAEARSDLLAIVNDDVLFADEALYEAAAILRRGRFAMVGPDSSCFLHQPADGRVSHRVASGLRFRYGTFMCMRRSDYDPIPDQLLIWGGDDWLFWRQRRPNAVLVRTAFCTSMGTTSGASEFQQLREREQLASDQLFAEVYGTRWWHRPATMLERLRMTRARCQQWMRRIRER